MDHLDRELGTVFVDRLAVSDVDDALDRLAEVSNEPGQPHISPDRDVPRGCCFNLSRWGVVTSLDNATSVLDESRSLPHQVPNWTATWLMAAIPFIATLVSTARGPGLSPDSINYISTGLNLADGKGLISYTGETLTIFPPGLPLVVAVGELLGVGPSWTMRLVNAAALAAIVLLSAVLLERHVTSRRLAQGATLFVAVAVAMLNVASMAWSEPLFLVVTLVFLLGMERALAEPDRLLWLFGCAVLVWAAFSTRYAGVSLIAVGGTTLLIGLWKTSPVVAARNAAVFGVLASAGPVAWMLRNRRVNETFLGPRPPSHDTPGEVAYLIVETFGRWAVPLPLPGRFAALTADVERPLLRIVGLGLLATLVAGTLFVLKKSRNSQTAPITLSLLPTAVFGLGYTAYLSLAQLNTALDPIDSRLLSPVFVPLVLAVTVALDRWAPLSPPWLRRVTGVALVALVALQSTSFIYEAVRWGQNGKGFATVEAQQSELAATTGDLADGAALYASSPFHIWAVTGREPVFQSPKLHEYRSPDDLLEVPAEFIRDAACGEAYLAWLDSDNGSWQRTPEQLAEVVSLEPVAQLADGTLYRLGPIGTPNCGEAASG